MLPKFLIEMNFQSNLLEITLFSAHDILSRSLLFKKKVFIFEFFGECSTHSMFGHPVNEIFQDFVKYQAQGADVLKQVISKILDHDTERIVLGYCIISSTFENAKGTIHVHLPTCLAGLSFLPYESGHELNLQFMVRSDHGTNYEYSYPRRETKEAPVEMDACRLFDFPNLLRERQGITDENRHLIECPVISEKIRSHSFFLHHGFGRHYDYVYFLVLKPDIVCDIINDLQVLDFWLQELLLFMVRHTSRGAVFTRGFIERNHNSDSVQFPELNDYLRMPSERDCNRRVQF